MNPNLTKLYLALRHTDLTEAEKDEFLGSCAFADDTDLATFNSLLIERPSRVRPILENIRKKRDALHRKDVGAWKEIIQNEIDELEKFQASV